MRVILMHNPTAGSEDHSARDLARTIRAAGHRVVADVSRRKDLAAALRRRCDLVAVAGGDGTVGAAAQHLARTGVPLAILPLGTANNVARTLGFTAPIEALIDAWGVSAVRGFDQALARRGDEATRFIEALGFGVFPEVMCESEKLPAPDGKAAVLARHRELFEAVLARAEPAAYTVSADGEDLSGEYLLVEVMNIPSLGPNLPIAPGARPGDGRLDLVLVAAAAREALLERLGAPRSAARAAARAASRQVRQVVISSAQRRYHRDGKVHAVRRSRDHVDVQVEPHALQVLVPPAR